MGGMRAADNISMKLGLLCHSLFPVLYCNDGCFHVVNTLLLNIVQTDTGQALANESSLTEKDVWKY